MEPTEKTEENNGVVVTEDGVRHPISVAQYYINNHFTVAKPFVPTEYIVHLAKYCTFMPRIGDRIVSITLPIDLGEYGKKMTLYRLNVVGSMMKEHGIVFTMQQDEPSWVNIAHFDPEA